MSPAPHLYAKAGSCQEEMPDAPSKKRKSLVLIIHSCINSSPTCFEISTFRNLSRSLYTNLRPSRLPNRADMDEDDDECRDGDPDLIASEVGPALMQGRGA